MFHRGMELFSDRNMWAPALSLDFFLLAKPASECVARTMSLERYKMTLSGYLAQQPSSWWMALFVSSVADACWESIYGFTITFYEYLGRECVF